MSEWRKVKLSELRSKNSGAIAIGPFGSRMKADCYVSFGAPVIRGTNISDGRKWKGDWVYVSEQVADSMPNCNVRSGDLVFPHRGSIGEVAIIPNDSLRYMISTSLMKFTADPEKANPLYLFYYFRSPSGRSEIMKYASQVGTPGIGQPLASMKQFEVYLPSLAEQNNIVSLLAVIDDKIELNHQMNETLEVTARALFKSWFVDFDPVKAKAEGREPEGMDDATAALFPSRFTDSPLGPIPEGWEVKGLDKIATFLNGLALQKYPALDPENYLPVIKISQLRSGDIAGADKASTDVPPDYIIRDGDILFSWSGSLEVEIWCGGRGALNQHLFKVSSKDFPKWFYFSWTRQHLDNFQKIAESKATTMGHIQRKHLSEAKVICPPVSVIQGVNEIMEPMLEKFVQVKLENRNLAYLRDLLLPRLISGKLRVGEISEIVEALAS